MLPPNPKPGAVAALADVAASIINAAVCSTLDSQGRPVATVQAGLLQTLQHSLRDVYPDPRDHNRTLANALARDLRG